MIARRGSPSEKGYTPQPSLLVSADLAASADAGTVVWSVEDYTGTSVMVEATPGVGKAVQMTVRS